MESPCSQRHRSPLRLARDALAHLRPGLHQTHLQTERHGGIPSRWAGCASREGVTRVMSGFGGMALGSKLLSTLFRRATLIVFLAVALTVRAEENQVVLNVEPGPDNPRNSEGSFMHL